MQTYLEQAFGKSDCSSVKMRGGGAGVDGLILRRFPQRRGRQCAAGGADRIETMQNKFLPSMTCIGTSTTIGRRSVIRTP